MLPGEELLPDELPRSKKGTLTLGPGVRHIVGGSEATPNILTTTSGALKIDNKKGALWLEHATGGRYQPTVGDLVIAQIHHSSADTWHCILTPHTPLALLGQLAFEGTTKKNKPNLKAGDLVYARISKCSKWEDTEIECFNSATGKSEGMGPLKAGCLFDVSAGFSRRLMMGSGKGGVVILEEVGEKVKFEVAVGRNGKVWIDSGSVMATVTIGRLLRQTDEEGWSIEEQKKAVKKALKDVGS